MSAELFEEYVGYSIKDAPVAASVVEQGPKVKRLAQFTGGTAVGRVIRGGSVVLKELILNGETAKVGDYIVALDSDVFVAVKKDLFEAKYKRRGPLRSPLV